MKIIERDIQFYIQKLRLGERFSIAGYSDAEWFSILGHRLGKKTGLGQILDADTGKKLSDILFCRQDTPNFMFAIPDILIDGAYFKKTKISDKIQRYLQYHEIDTDWYERDMVTDNLARDAGLHPFIKQLQKMAVHIVGNNHLRGLEFLNYKHFFEISSPNLHMEKNGINQTVRDILDAPVDGVYLVSAGVSAAIIIDRVYDHLPNSWFIDCASIWDAFVGIGGQRQWRADLYADEEKYQEWLNANLHGKN